MSLSSEMLLISAGVAITRAFNHCENILHCVILQCCVVCPECCVVT